jgi:hypothetical protein
MMPMESAAIIRGLLRVRNATDALEVLHDELSLPLEVSRGRGFEGGVESVKSSSHPLTMITPGIGLGHSRKPGSSET